MSTKGVFTPPLPVSLSAPRAAAPPRRPLRHPPRRPPTPCRRMPRRSHARSTARGPSRCARLRPRCSGRRSAPGRPGRCRGLIDHRDDPVALFEPHLDADRRLPEPERVVEEVPEDLFHQAGVAVDDARLGRVHRDLARAAGVLLEGRPSGRCRAGPWKGSRPPAPRAGPRPRTAAGPRTRIAASSCRSCRPGSRSPC
jgi:hypothetical protein